MTVRGKAREKDVYMNRERRERHFLEEEKWGKIRTVGYRRDKETENMYGTFLHTREEAQMCS